MRLRPITMPIMQDVNVGKTVLLKMLNYTTDKIHYLVVTVCKYDQRYYYTTYEGGTDEGRDTWVNQLTVDAMEVLGER